MYQLNAIIGDFKQLQTAALATPPAVVVPLTNILGLIPLSEQLFNAINQNGTEDYEEGGARKFTYLSAKIAAWIRSVSAGGIIPYVEADYWGGLGRQCAVAWKDGIEVMPPSKAEGKAIGAINHALKLIGVQTQSGLDEFDTAGLSRHRNMKDWLEAAERSLEEDLERQRLRRSWSITRWHLDSATEFLPDAWLDAAERGPMAQYYEWIYHNELELALDELERLGDENGATTAFWRELLVAAENMGLAQHAGRYKDRIGE
jgi:hypothetical protein